MKKDDNHKKDYRKKIESKLYNLVHEHLSNINKEATTKLAKTIQESVKQIAKKFYKSHFSVENEKNEKVISDIVKAKSFKKLTSKKIPESLSSIKFDKIFEEKNEVVKSKLATKKQTPVKKVLAKKTIPLKKAIDVKKQVAVKKVTVSKPTAKKASSVLSSIPKEFKLTISKKTSKK